MTAINGYKIFEVSEDEWYVAVDSYAAFTALSADFNCTDEDLIDNDLMYEEGPYELSDEQVSKLLYYDPVKNKTHSFLEELVLNPPTTNKHFASGNN